VTLLLLPNLLDESLSHRDFLPQSVDEAVSNIDGLIAESDKSARAFLKRFSFTPPKTFREVPISLLNEHTDNTALLALLTPLERGERWGLISDCGLPSLADPGASLVALAHKRGIQIQAYPGPSSLVLALQLSGLSGQRFAFHGYPKKEALEMQRQMRLLEQLDSTHLFIEAPYRSGKFLEQLIGYLSDKTLLSVAWDLTLPTQCVITEQVASWRIRSLPNLHKRPAIFLFQSIK